MSLWILLRRSRRPLQLTLDQRRFQLCGHTNPPVPGAAQVNPPGSRLSCAFFLSFIIFSFHLQLAGNTVFHSGAQRGGQTFMWHDVMPPPSLVPAGAVRAHHGVTDCIPGAVLCIPRRFCKCRFVLPNPSPFHPALQPPPIWQPSVCSLHPRVCFCCVCSFILFFRFHT